MKIVYCAITLAIGLLLTGCLGAGPTPEQIEVRAQNDELLAEAKAGKIKWVDFARAANANAGRLSPNFTTPEIQEAFAYRVVLAQQVDQKKITPEEYDFEWAKFLADHDRQARAAQIAAAAAMPQSIPQPYVYSAPHIVSCNTVGPSTMCNY